MTNQRWVFVQRPGPEGANESLFKLEDCPMPPPLQDGEALVGSYLFSLDPTIHNALRSEENSMTDQSGKSGYYDFMKWSVGSTPMWMQLGVVKESKNAALPEGAFVRSFSPWQVFNVVTQAEPLKIPDGVQPENYMSALGMTGQTAAKPILKWAKTKAGETAFVSGAAGATGLVAAQLLKAQGATVIGSAGTPEKVRAARVESAPPIMMLTRRIRCRSRCWRASASRRSTTSRRARWRRCRSWRPAGSTSILITCTCRIEGS